MILHPKFYFFDTGVYRILRPSGPLDSPEEAQGSALETLLFQELRAINDYLHYSYQLHYWRTSNQQEVDFVLYGERGLKAFEVKRSSRLNSHDFKGLKAFQTDFPMSQAFLIYGGNRKMREGNIQVIPFTDCVKELPQLLK